MNLVVTILLLPQNQGQKPRGTLGGAIQREGKGGSVRVCSFEKAHDVSVQGSDSAQVALSPETRSTADVGARLEESQQTEETRGP